MSQIVLDRIFAKLHSKKMLEFSRSGLNNCFCLFLTLAALADLDDVLVKICDILDVVKPDLLEPDKFCAIWKAMFALMLIGEEQQYDLEFPATKMADGFNFLASQASESPDPVQIHMISALVTVYLEGLQDVFEYSTHLNLSEYILIASGFSDLLSRSPLSDVELALSVLEVILARHKILHKKQLLVENGIGEVAEEKIVDKEHYEALSEALCSHVVPLLKEQIIGEVPHQLLASVAAGITVMMLDTPTRPCLWKESFKTILEYFGLNLQTNAELCCKYLTNLLSQPMVIKRMESQMPDCQSKIIRAWFRLGMQVSPHSLDYRDLSRHVFKLPEVDAIFLEAELECQSFNNQTDAITLLLRALEIQHSRKFKFSFHANSGQKINVYLADIIPVFNMALRRNEQSQITQVYSVVGNVVGRTPSLIYVKGKPDCLLSVIVSSLLLPKVVYDQSKIVPPAMLASLKDNLELVVAGIASLGFRRDPYIKRTLKDMFIHYLPRFSPQIYPLVGSLINILRNNEYGLEVFLFSIEVIRDRYLLHTGTAGHLDMALNFMAEILSRTTLKDRTSVCPILLQTLLKLSLLLDKQSTKQKALDLVKMFGFTETNEDENCRCLKSSLEDVVGQYFGTRHDRVFHLLGLLHNIFPITIRQLLPYLAEQISKTEQKKGVGQHSALRLKYSQFLADSNLIFNP